MKCPCCNGSGEIVPQAPVYLSRMQSRIWHFVRRSGDGISSENLIDRIYADHPDGGPLNARRSIWVTIVAANKRLSEARQRIVARGGIYRLEHLS